MTDNPKLAALKLQRDALAAKATDNAEILAWSNGKGVLFAKDGTVSEITLDKATALLRQHRAAIGGKATGTAVVVTRSKAIEEYLPTLDKLIANETPAPVAASK